MISDFNKQINALETRYRQDLDEVIKARDAWIGTQWPMYKSGKFAIAYLQIDQWKCEKSPIEICIYNEEEDMWHESCIFCEEPEDR